MRFPLTLLCGTGLGFMLSHFPVLSDGVGSFHWFINNLISCPLVSFLRSFFSISILYGLVFKFLFPYLYYMVLSLSRFLGRVTISLFISILYGLVFRPFLGRVTIWSSLSICILYGLVFKPFLGGVTMFLSTCIYYSHISLSPFGCISLRSNDSNGISRTIYSSLMNGALLVYSF